MGKKLSNQDVLAIRRAAAEGVARKELREAYGVGLETIARICRGDTHAGVGAGSVEALRKQELGMAEQIAGSAARLLEMLAAEEKSETPRVEPDEDEETRELARKSGAQV